MSRRFATLMLACAACWPLPSLAAAQVGPDVAAARRDALEGNFDQARAALDGALRGGDLSRDDLVAIYEARVFIHFAAGDTNKMRADLERIAALDADHTFDADYYPTGVTDVFRELVRNRAGQLSLEAEAVVLASGEFEVRAEAQNDPSDLAREVLVYGRGVGDEWTMGEGSVRVDPAGAASAEYYAEAVGPGGAIVATRGTDAMPLTVELAQGGPSDEGGGVPLWVWVAGGAALVAIVVIIIAVAASSGGVSEDTQPTGPMVRFSM